jgi:hypothetical protein
MTGNPTEGGSYIKDKDGTLKRVESTQQAGPEPAAPDPASADKADTKAVPRGRGRTADVEE